MCVSVFGRLVGCLLVSLFVCVCVCAWLFVCFLFVCVFVCLCVCVFVCLFVRLFVCLCATSAHRSATLRSGVQRSAAHESVIVHTSSLHSTTTFQGSIFAQELFTQVFCRRDRPVRPACSFVVPQSQRFLCAPCGVRFTFGVSAPSFSSSASETKQGRWRTQQCHFNAETDIAAADTTRVPCCVCHCTPPRCSSVVVCLCCGLCRVRVFSFSCVRM